MEGKGGVCPVKTGLKDLGRSLKQETEEMRMGGSGS